MRRLLVLAAALAMMFGVEALNRAAPGTPENPVTLAAIGFVVLAAFTAGEIGGSFGLPRVTGYIVSGMLLGPQTFDVLSRDVVKEMGTFNMLAVGLIATTAGLELDLVAIRKVLRTILATVAAKIPLLLILVGGSFILIETYVPLLDLGSSERVYAMALLFGVLGLGTSPAITLAVINESKAKGRLADIVLAMAVVKDLVVVVSLAVAIAIAKVLIVPGSSIGPGVLMHVLEELGSSLLVGAAFGAALIAYVRFVREEMLLVVLVTVLLAAELSKALHLELLLVLITAGFVVRNVSGIRHQLEERSERCPPR
ncbi:MAG: hypothetical protein HC923_13720, partial [Myxococcales bacterium]|nr:hypothetical protein [Myxococcales bacterium]